MRTIIHAYANHSYDANASPEDRVAAPAKPPVRGTLTGRPGPGFGVSVPAMPQFQQAQQQAGPAPASF